MNRVSLVLLTVSVGLLSLFGLTSVLRPIESGTVLAKEGAADDVEQIENMRSMVEAKQAVMSQQFSADTQIFLPVIIVPPPPKDMAEYMIGDGRLYEVWHSANDSQGRYQTQTADVRFFHTKGNEYSAEWEELWATEDVIYRGTDTSPGADLYYTLYTGTKAGSPWSPRYWRVGEIYRRSPRVVFFQKSDCSIIHDDSDIVTWLKFEAFHESYTFDSGITLQNVVELAWLLDLDEAPEERYYYAEGYGLVGWQSAGGYYSNISEIFKPDERPDNTREVIPCLNKSSQTLEPNFDLPPIPEWLVRKVK